MLGRGDLVCTGIGLVCMSNVLAHCYDAVVVLTSMTCP